MVVAVERPTLRIAPDGRHAVMLSGIQRHAACGSATDPAPARTLVGSPDGRVLSAVGVGPHPGSSSGIWVFDTHTLRLLERWPALASYESMTLFEDGRWLAAVGRPGLTAAGGPARWGTSVTVHDTVTGRPVLRIGDLGTDDAVAFPWPGPVAATPYAPPPGQSMPRYAFWTIGLSRRTSARSASTIEPVSMT